MKRKNEKEKRKPLIPLSPKGKPGLQSWMLLVLTIVIILITYLYGQNRAQVISEHRFEQMVLNGEVEKVVFIAKQNLIEVTLTPQALQKDLYQKEVSQKGFFSTTLGPQYAFNSPSPEVFDRNFKALEQKLEPAKRIGYTTENRSDIFSFIFNWGYLILLIAGFFFFMRKMSGGLGPGGQLFNIGKSKATLFDAENKVKISFDNVAGLAEAKEELKEIVDFLKHPDKYTKLGAKIPKGALLIGPPGTGKTLLAKAVAGEAHVPFFSLSGSDFVEMFVGVGAARVRDLFKRAKEKAPCIIFIDEIDAVGRSRGRGNMPGGNDERENTLNSLLVEMDGFGTNSGVMILAATNRPGILDKALLRPGRFDRQIGIDKPDIIDRKAIFEVHIKPLKVDKSVKAATLAEQTPGFVGAEIANVCNEAALIAARKGKKSINMKDFQAALDRVIGGLEKKNKIISPQEKKIIAYHEAGHAIAGWFLEHADPLVKVTIVPRGIATLGYAQYLPKEQFLYQQDQLFDTMCMALGGRAAEELSFGKISTGALNDLEKVTKTAYSTVVIYGMNKKLGHLSFHNSNEEDYNFTKPYSEATSELIDIEVRALVELAYQRVKKLLSEKNQALEMIAEELLKREVLFQSDLEELIGKRPFDEAPKIDTENKLSQP